MRKVLCMSLLLVQLAATAFAYTDKESGFKALSPAGDNYITAVGKGFYGFVEDGGANAGYAEVIAQEQADKFFGSPFTTAVFEKKYNDILLLQRNGVSRQQILKLVDNVFVSPLFALADGEKPDYSLEAQKLGGNKYIVVKYAAGESGEQSLYFTSANDKLYMLIAMQQPAKAQNLPESTVGVIAGTNEKPASMPGEKFLKKFKTIKPQPQSQPQSQPLSFSDKTAGYTVSLPDDWFYLQLKDDYNDQTVCFSAALPLEAMREVGAQALDLGVTDLDSAITAVQEEANSSDVKAVKADYYDVLRHGILLCSVKMDDSRWTDELFANPNKTTLETRQMLEEFKTYLAEYQRDVKSYAYDVNVEDGQGSFNLQTELKPAETDFYYTLVAEGKVIGKGAYLAFVFDRNGDDENTALKFWNGKTLLKD